MPNGDFKSYVFGSKMATWASRFGLSSDFWCFGSMPQKHDFWTPYRWTNKSTKSGRGAPKDQTSSSSPSIFSEQIIDALWKSHIFERTSNIFEQIIQLLRNIHIFERKIIFSKQITKLFWTKCVPTHIFEATNCFCLWKIIFSSENYFPKQIIKLLRTYNIFRTK